MAVGYVPPAGVQIQPGSGLSFPWAEFVSRAGHTSDFSAGQDGQSINAGFMIIIPFSYLNDALRELIGFSERDDSSPGNIRLSRTLPWRHPMYQQLWCTRIVRAQGVKWMAKSGNIILGPEGSSRTGYFSAYSHVLLTLQFSRPLYPLFDNAYAWATGEWVRFTDRYWQIQTEINVPEGMQYRFAEGAPTGQPFPGGVGRPLPRINLKRTWYQLPEAAVYTSDGYPYNFIEDASGSGATILSTINNAVFFGCPIGTLLYLNPEITPHPLPLPGNLMGVAGEQFTQQFDVTFNFGYFNPPLGSAGPAGVPPAPTTRGWNNMPWAGDGKFYLVESIGGLGVPAGSKPFSSYDFRKLFQIR